MGPRRPRARGNGTSAIPLGNAPASGGDGDGTPRRRVLDATWPLSGGPWARTSSASWSLASTSSSHRRSRRKAADIPRAPSSTMGLPWARRKRRDSCCSAQRSECSPNAASTTCLCASSRQPPGSTITRPSFITSGANATSSKRCSIGTRAPLMRPSPGASSDCATEARSRSTRSCACSSSRSSTSSTTTTAG